MPREPRLTPDLTRRIVSYIRAGGYDWLAAQAAGVSRTVFRGWLERGAAGGRQPYRGFYLDVEQARAHARLSAEIQVREKDAKFWLRHGLGRETPDGPGWTVAVKPAAPAGAEHEEGLAAWFLEALGLVSHALLPFPDAHAAVDRAMDGAAVRVRRPAR